MTTLLIDGYAQAEFRARMEWQSSTHQGSFEQDKFSTNSCFLKAESNELSCTAEQKQQIVETWLRNHVTRPELNWVVCYE